MSKLENCTDDSELMLIPFQCTDPLNQTWVDGQQPPECEWSWVDQMSGVSKASIQLGGGPSMGWAFSVIMNLRVVWTLASSSI